MKILGGEGANRLQQVLRSQQQLTYGASADLDTYKYAGAIVAETDTQTANTAEALRVVVDEFSRLQRERVNDGELEGAQDYMVGHFPLTIETPDAIATQVLNQLFYELPVEELPTLPRARPEASRPTTSSAWRGGSSGPIAAVGRARRRRRQVRQRPEGRRLRRRSSASRSSELDLLVGRLQEAVSTASMTRAAVVRRAVRRSVRRRARRGAARAASPDIDVVRPRRRAASPRRARAWSPTSTASRSPA